MCISDDVTIILPSHNSYERERERRVATILIVAVLFVRLGSVS